MLTTIDDIRARFSLGYDGFKGLARGLLLLKLETQQLELIL